MPESTRSVHPTAYSDEYFLTECDGWVEYLESGGISPTRRLLALWEFLDILPGMKVLDIGCGRGELIVYCSLHGCQAVGVDYSSNALRLAYRAITRAKSCCDEETWRSPSLSHSNAKRLPFPNDEFDRVIMGDIVEHLYPEELHTALREAHRVLRPGGELLVHTMPNLWYYRYGYPLFRLVQWLRGVTLPTDPRDRIPFSHVHVNEQTPRTLRHAIRPIGYSHWRIWLQDYREYTQYGSVMRHSMRLLTSLPVVKWIFCDDIFARARK